MANKLSKLPQSRRPSKKLRFFARQPMLGRFAVVLIASAVIGVVAMYGLSPTLAATVSNTYSPATQTVQTGSNVTITITTNAGTSQVLTDQLRVTFDSSKLQYVSVDYTGSPLDTDAPDAGIGTNYFQISRYTLNPKPTGNFILAKLTFKALATTGTTSLAYDATNSSVYVQEDNGAANALATVTGTSLTFDGVAPSISVTSPVNNTTIAGVTTFSANATDTVGVTKVEFKVDGTVRATDTVSPYSTTIDAAALSVGSHTFSAVAYDGVGYTTTATVTVTVADTTKPTVSITTPANGATVTGTVTVNATASDNVGVTRVEFSIDGVLHTTDTTAPYSASVDALALTSAVHTITAKAYDMAGNSQTGAVSVTVLNEPGDVNSDGTVTIQDLAILIANYGRTTATRPQGDLNGDGKVTIQDLAILIAYYGQ